MTRHEQFIAQRNRSLKSGILTICALVVLLALPLAIGHVMLSPVQAQADIKH